MYLGSKPRKVLLKNVVEAWANTVQKYVQESVSNPEAYLHEYFGGRKFSKKVSIPFQSNYDPLMDLSAEMIPILLNYLKQNGVLRWMVELGRIYITTEVSMVFDLT